MAERKGYRLLFSRTNELRQAFRYVTERHRVRLDTVVILPDHLHCTWALPPGDTDFFARWNLLQRHFSRAIEKAELLLLDEPVAGISPQYREQITVLIRRMQQQGKTVLMIEHNTDFIEATGQCFLFLDGGILTQFDTFTQLQNSREAADGYF